MALIKCPECGKEISDKAIKCPRCGEPIKKIKLIFPVMIITIFLIVCACVYFGWNLYQDIQAQKMDELLEQVTKYYDTFDFDSIEACYNELDELGYSTSNERAILEYERSVYEDAYGYYVAISELNDKVQEGGYASLRLLIDNMIEPTQKFEKLEINPESEIGKYIDTVRSNLMYISFNSEFVNSTRYNVDSGFTASGYARVVGTYTREIAKIEFPMVE